MASRLELSDLPRTRGGTFTEVRKAVMNAVNRNKNNPKYMEVLRGILMAAVHFIDAYTEAQKPKEPSLGEIVGAFTDKDKFEDWAREEYDFELDGRATLDNMKKEFVKLYKAQKEA